MAQGLVKAAGSLVPWGCPSSALWGVQAPGVGCCLSPVMHHLQSNFHAQMIYEEKKSKPILHRFFMYLPVACSGSWHHGTLLPTEPEHGCPPVCVHSCEPVLAAASGAVGKGQQPGLP